MVRMITAVIPAESDAWVFIKNNTCRGCGAVYRIERSDRQLSGWWYKLRELSGCFPKARYTNHGNGPVLELPYMICNEVDGLAGLWVLSRCMNCRAYCYTAQKEVSDEGQ